MIEFKNQALLLDWGLDKLGISYTNQIIALGSIDPLTRRILGVMLYDNWTGSACDMHMAGEPGWATREFLWAAFDYPFNQAKCKIVLGRIAWDNKHSLNIALRAGFKLLYEIEDGYPDGPQLLLGMRKEDCKWLEYKHG